MDLLLWNAIAAITADKAVGSEERENGEVPEKLMS
jgi:hypothetical protein